MPNGDPSVGLRDIDAGRTMNRGEQSNLELYCAFTLLLVVGSVLFYATKPTINTCVPVLGVSLCVAECQAVVLALIVALIGVSELMERRLDRERRAVLRKTK